MRNYIDELLLLLVSLLFGFSYSFQSIAAEYVDPFAFSLAKFVIGFIVLLPIALKKDNTNIKKTIIFGIVQGIILTSFSYLQQIAALANQPGKTGFITSLYIIEVPFINLVIYKNKINKQTLISLLFALIGLVLLCDLSSFSFNKYDFAAIFSSLLLALQIIMLGKYCQDINSVKLNAVSFLVNIVFCLIGSLINSETISVITYSKIIVPLLFLGVGCSGLCCPLQAYAQKTLDETTASLILSLESLFAVFAGYLLMDVVLSKKELVGCLFMFISVVMCITADKKITKE